MGEVLKEFGTDELIQGLALRFFGHLSGGPAKLPVISSALFGSISESGVANVI